MSGMPRMVYLGMARNVFRVGSKIGVLLLRQKKYLLKAK
jgi:hypothetical protein